AGGAAQRLLNGQDLPGQWWTLFRSPQINRMVERAVMSNQSLASAQATLRQARYQMFAQAGTFLPQVDVQGTIQRNKSNQAFFGSSTSTSFGAVAAFQYTLDIFGGNRRQFEAVGAVEDYQRFQMEATYLNLISNVC